MRKRQVVATVLLFIATMVLLLVTIDELFIDLLGWPAWTPLPITLPLVAVTPTMFIRKLRRAMQPEREPSNIWVDTGNALDPHGDGTLRPGDPWFDNVLGPMMRGQFQNGAFVVRHPEGIFEVYERHD